MSKVGATLKTANSALEERSSGSTGVRTHHFTDAVAERWNRFVFQQPTGSLFHLLGWKRAIEKTFGFQSCYAYAERDGVITGVAPVFSISSWVVGRCLVSAPFAVYGGICAADNESEEELVRHLKELAYNQQVDYLELRYRQREMIPGFVSNPLYATFTAPLCADHEANLKRLPKDTRYMIRKAAKEGLTSRRGMDQMDQFYRLFAFSMKRLGTPVFPRSLFDNLAREFPESVDLLLVYQKTEPVSGVFSFRFRDTMLPYYAGARAESTRLAANNFMYAELMKIASEEGLRHFDFGRSKKGTGAYAFKTQWNMNIEPLAYQVHLVRRKELPNFTPLNPKFELATRLWRRMPLGLTTLFGPRVVKWFP
jgi:FemAB-related protein (PEP-CTERM system-associated)